MLQIAPVPFTTWVTLLAIALSNILIVESYTRLRGRRLAERSYHGQLAARRAG